MSLELTFYGDTVSFNIDAIIDEQLDDTRLDANTPTPIRTLDQLDISNYNDEYDNETKIRSIPESIERLTNLETLAISDHRLQTLPRSIGNLTGLRYLFLNSNRITTLPDTFTNLTNLRYLNLNNNRLRRVPDIGNFLQLTHLDLSRNPLTHIPASIANLTELRTCNLPDNILLFPLQEEYLFSNRLVLDEIRRVFNIDRYNELMEAEVEAQNEDERKVFRNRSKSLTINNKKMYNLQNRPSRKVFSKKKHLDHIESFLGRSVPKTTLGKNTSIDRFLANTRWSRHIQSMLGTRYVPKVVEEVIRFEN